ncbi:hemolysin XhlA family protein [Cohnella lupini]|uniref:Hemolysin XhlA n=1 Tax=Cohnella lupini TaxID=1294267 RepID=A0A3D9HZ83_9BACL|nr:hemolysin XhlA family protein [Cohnella lupini]RED54807.1 hemolysin XhlA [Cohnella lupini]
MSGEEVKDLKDVRERVVRMETKIDGIIGDLRTASEARDVANEAALSVRSAHKRIDRIDKLINWVGTTIIGSVILALIAYIVKGGLAQ